MNTQEEINCGVKSFVDLEFSEAFKPSTELSIRVLSNVIGCENLRVHEFLERSVTRLLENHLIVKGIANKVVDLGFKG